MTTHIQPDDHLQASTPSDFDARSGSVLERLLFNHRLAVVLICVLTTAVLAWQAGQLRLTASFERNIPTSDPMIINYLQHKADLKGLGNTLRIVVETRAGSIFDADYLRTLQAINDEVFLLPGVDRSFMKSLWTPATRWIAVTEEGLDGGPVMPADYDGTAASLARVRENVARSGEIGQLVAADFKSSALLVPLLENDPATGERLDYHAFSERIEALRAKYQNDDVRIHVTGFAKVAGDLIDGLQQMLAFFAVALSIAAVVLYGYTRCLRSTLLVVFCSLIAVVWLLGLLPALGYELDPYSVLVPFLVFAIGISHGAQKMNGIMQDIGRGAHSLVAARYTFRRLFLAGLTALLADAVGFAVLMVIDIPVIQDLAVTASIGVAVLIFSNLVLLPILLSYTGVSPVAARRSITHAEAVEGDIWSKLGAFTTRRYALPTLLLAAALGLGGLAVGRHLKTGDLDPGAPELRADSVYNRDNAFIVANYAASSDIFVVMVSTPAGGCAEYGTLRLVDALEWRLRQLPGVESTGSLATLAKLSTTGYNEGSLKWYELLPNAGTLGAVVTRAPRDLFNQNCDLLSLYVYLRDHKSDTLDSVVAEVGRFADEHADVSAKFLMAAGNAGIAAATNKVVREADRQMLLLVYAAVALLSLLTFRSWRAVLCALLPLMLTSILCEALMVALGIGVKVATLPVIALGVGIGVDYALYVMTVTLAWLRQGDTLTRAYGKALRFTGRVVVLTGLTLGIGVATWAFSPIKFQADMGILLAFMFVWNMVGALVLLPCLAYWLLKPNAKP